MTKLQSERGSFIHWVYTKDSLAKERVPQYTKTCQFTRTQLDETVSFPWQRLFTCWCLCCYACSQCKYCVIDQKKVCFYKLIWLSYLPRITGHVCCHTVCLNRVMAAQLTATDFFVCVHHHFLMYIMSFPFAFIFHALTLNNAVLGQR